MVMGSLVFAALILIAMWVWTNPASKRAVSNERFEATACWFKVTRARPALCGYLLVPERHGRTDGRQLRLPVVILKRSGGASRREPIVYLTGGPGGPAYIAEQADIDGWWGWAERLPPGHDLVLFDQRGNGKAEPRLDCPEAADPRIWAGASEQPQTVVSNPRPAYRRAVASCLGRLLAEQHDLGAYNSRESAADVADLRQALGLDRWTLYGVSYGTRLALTVMRYHPQGIRSVILDSVFPPQAPEMTDLVRYFNRVIRLLFRECRADQACRSAYPNLGPTFSQLLRKLAAEPVTLALSGNDHWPALHFRINHVEFLNILYFAFYAWDNILLLPWLIDTTSQGYHTGLQIFAQHYYLDETRLDDSLGVFLSVICHEEIPFEDPQAIKAESARYPLLQDWISKDLEWNQCAGWPAGQAAAIENTPVESDIPTLLLVGSYDPITPPELAHQAAEGLVQSYLFEFRGIGHAVFDSDFCAGDLMVEFLADPGRRPDPDCFADLEPPKFSILPANVSPPD